MCKSPLQWSMCVVSDFSFFVFDEQIKSVLIQLYAHPKDAVLDIACGKVSNMYILESYYIVTILRVLRLIRFHLSTILAGSLLIVSYKLISQLLLFFWFYSVSIVFLLILNKFVLSFVLEGWWLDQMGQGKNWILRGRGYSRRLGKCLPLYRFLFYNRNSPYSISTNSYIWKWWTLSYWSSLTVLRKCLS